MQAPADGIIILRREGSGFTLKITGRDVEEQDLAVAFEGGKWRKLGDASEHRMSKERKQILGVITEQTRLGDRGEPMTPANIAVILGYKSANVRRLLYSYGNRWRHHAFRKGVLCA